MLKVTSREYKLMLDHRPFDDRDSAVPAFWKEATEFARPLGVEPHGEFDKPKQRTIVFLDTLDFALKANGLILRQRSKKNGETEYTLKCRSEDRFVAAAADVRAAGGRQGESKFEEDIAAPFRSRYSHSHTVAADDTGPSPASLGDASRLFRCLGQLTRDGMRCLPETPLYPVNSVRAFERVFTGPELDLGDEQAEVALILWSNGSKGRPLVAEFSLRYANRNEKYRPDVAKRARDLFLLLQRLDWCRPQAMTKTEYVYRTAAPD